MLLMHSLDRNEISLWLRKLAAAAVHYLKSKIKLFKREWEIIKLQYEKDFILDSIYHRSLSSSLQQ